jgi:multidrug resistance efflux pump
MERLEPIRSPFGYRWREFRINLVPVIVFFTVLGLVAVSWKHYIAAPSVIGEVENARVNLIHTQPGLLAELNVERFQKVTKAQVIGRLYTLDPEQLKASVAAIEADVKVLKARMAVDEERNELNYEQLRLDSLARRAELAIARANLQQAELELQRVTQLHKEKVASDFEFDVATRDRARLVSEVSEKEKLLTHVEQSLGRLSPGPRQNPKAELFSAAIQAQENRLMLLEGPLLLKAPIDGVVSFINHRPGERVMAGDPILTISPEHSDRIIGYLRQPLSSVPKVGSPVKVRTRGPARQTGIAKVLQIGGDMQPITAPMRIRGYDTSQERGLPFLVEVPAGMAVVPGELVDLILLQ